MHDAALAGLRDAAAAGAAPRVAEQLLALFEQAAVQPDKLQWVNRQIAGDLHGAIDPALTRACAAVAAAMDAQHATYDRLGYHNRQHFCEVALTAYGLCLLNRLGTGATQLVVLAALLHDAVHEGRPQPAFTQERASVESMRPLLGTAGLAAAQIDRLLAMVLATETAGGTAFMATACRQVPCAVPAAAPELAALAGDAELAGLARILCEADVLPSIGLGSHYASRVQERLAVEWRRPLDEQDKLQFMDAVLQQGYIGDFFLPGVHAMRAALALAHDAGPHAVTQG